MEEKFEKYELFSSILKLWIGMFQSVNWHDGCLRDKV